MNTTANDGREDGVHGGSGQGDQHALVTRTAQPCRVDGDRFGPSEDAGGRQGEERGDDQRPHGVDMHHGVQG